MPISVEPKTDNFKVILLRPQDLLYLRFEFINLTLKTGDDRGARLVRKEADKDTYIIVYFQPQNIAEEAFGESITSNDPSPLPIRARMAGESRLAFFVPKDIAEISYTTESLLNWKNYRLSVVPVAIDPKVIIRPSPVPPIVPPPPQLMKPEVYHTALELPYRLILSPNDNAGWAHAINAVTHDGRTELWHTRLGTWGLLRFGTLQENNRENKGKVRAVWSPDIDPNNISNAPPKVPPATPQPFPMSLTANDRYQIVRLSADFNIKLFSFPGQASSYYEPQPIQVDQLMLTSLGGWMRSLGAWAPPFTGSELIIEEWQHIATMGRDQYARVVKAGFLYPFAHRAVETTITERKFYTITQGSQAGNRVAYLRQRKFLIVREPEKRYADAKYPYEGREMPLGESIRLTTLTTPNLDLKPNGEPAELISGTKGAYWVRVGGSEFKFHVVAEDVEHQQSEFAAAMIFVPADADSNTINAVQAAYRDDTRRRCALSGQKVAFAKRLPSTEQKPTDTNLTAESLYFDTHIPQGSTNFLPKLSKADVRIPSVEQLLGTSQSVAIELYQGYLDKNAPNQANIFASLKNPLDLLFPADKAGGLATPNMTISGLSQTLGPVGGQLEKLASGNFDPADFFKSTLEAKLLGAVSLKDLIVGLFGDEQFPKMLTKTSPASGKPTSITTSLKWTPQVQSIGFFKIYGDDEAWGKPLDSNKKTILAIDAEIEKRLDNSDSKYHVTGRLTNFLLNFVNIIAVKFEEFKFNSEKGKKLDVSVNLAKDEPIKFLGPLSFLNQLRQYIPSDGFSDPPFLDIQATGVKVGYSLGLPSIGVGVFSLQNINLYAGVFLPFIQEKATLRFGFSERHHPFILTVSLFGGGGFFALELDMAGVQLLEAALEFGGNISINLGIASGGVYIMAGIYFKIAKNSKGQDESELTGYLRCGGHLSVLGIVSISVEFYLAFIYSKGCACGEATVTVKVEVLFFSKSVHLTVKRCFCGSSSSSNSLRAAAFTATAFTAGDSPTFIDLMDLPSWTAYADAFA